MNKFHVFFFGACFVFGCGTIAIALGSIAMSMGQWPGGHDEGAIAGVVACVLSGILALISIVKACRSDGDPTDDTASA